MNTCLKYIYVVLNLILLVGGIALIGFSIWLQYASGTHEALVSLKASSVVIYSLLGAGGAMAVLGLVGALGACYESRCFLGTYICIVTLILLFEIGLLVYSLVNKDNLKDQFLSIWTGFSNETKYLIQDRFSCCGYSNSSEWNGQFHASCINNSVLVNSTDPWSASCYDRMAEWVDTNVIVLGIIAGFVILFQIIQIIVAGCLVHSVGKTNKVNDDRSLGRSPRRRRDVDTDDEEDRRRHRGVYHNQAYDRERRFSRDSYYHDKYGRRHLRSGT